jgi:hypothetical protein
MPAIFGEVFNSHAGAAHFPRKFLDDRKNVVSVKGEVFEK